MSCVEKRHMSHRMGSMLHHRFPNGFTDLFMDETDREVSTLTDRAFRSLCVGDDAVYNDEFLYGYSPFSCHKPLAGEPLKKTHHKESKKHGQSKNDAQPWKQQKKNISHMSSFLKALSATEESREGMLVKNGSMTDCTGESWDKSALRSIQRELSEFSSDYHTNLRDRHYKNHLHSGEGSSKRISKDASLPSGKSSKIKNGKSTLKLRKLNIKNFFLHSEFSPFQTWTAFKQFPFGQEDTSITHNTPKWYDLPLYKELTEARRKDTLDSQETQSQTAAVETPPPPAAKPIPPPSPPKVLLEPTAAESQKKCSSDRTDGSAAPWRRIKHRAKSAIPTNQTGIPPQDNCSATVDERLLLIKDKVRSVEVKAVEEVSSLASTPFSICQLMTPLIPSRQPTETSEILQAVLSPSVLDLPLRPHSEAKLTPEPQVKRDSYKSLASSILFNLKDNRKRVKSRYSPPKFKTLEVPEGGTESPQSDNMKHPQAGSESNTSGLSTPAILKDGHTVYTPVLETFSTPPAGLTKHDADRPLSDDYLLSNLLQSKREVASNGSLGEENPIPLIKHSKKNRSPIAKKQNYPSLNLYKKASPVDSDMKYLQVPVNTNVPTDTNEPPPLLSNKEFSPDAPPKNTSDFNNDHSPMISQHALEKEGLPLSVSVGSRSPDNPTKTKRSMNDTTDFGTQPVNFKEKDTSSQQLSTLDVIRAAKEAISAAKNKALFVARSESNKKLSSGIEELREKEINEKFSCSKEITGSKSESSVTDNSKVLSQSRTEETGATQVDKNFTVKKDPPPVPKKTFVKSDIQIAFDKEHNIEKLTNGDLRDAKIDLLAKDSQSLQKRGKLKHTFSARQNSYIKCQRYTLTDDEQEDEHEECDLKENTNAQKDEEMIREMIESEHIMNDLHALKELERARLGDCIGENASNKANFINIDEEARVKNDLISKELRNIKKGMLSMRGNTSAKREIFAKKERDQSKQVAFTKIDSNVIINKALINDNYDKAKMALEEIISERQIRGNKITDQNSNQAFEQNAGNESYVTRVQQSKTSVKNSDLDTEEKQNGLTITEKEKDIRERLGDLRDHNHVRQILSQTEPRLGETHRSGGRIALPGMDKVDNELNALLQNKAKRVNEKNIDYPGNVTDDSETAHLSHTVRQVSQDTTENLANEKESKMLDAPAVPPRSKKGGSRRDVSITKKIDHLKDIEEDVFNRDEIFKNDDIVKEIASAYSRKLDVASDLSPKEAFSGQSETSSKEEMQLIVNDANLKPITLNDEVMCDSVSPSNENRLCVLSDINPARGTSCANSNVKAQETFEVIQKTPLEPDHLTIPDDSATKRLVLEDEPDKIGRDSDEENVDVQTLSEVQRDVLSPLLLINGININQRATDQGSLSSKSSYFSLESAMQRNTETDSIVYQSLENLIGEAEGNDAEGGDVTENSKQDSDRPEVEYYSLGAQGCESELVKQPIKSHQKEIVVIDKESKERENISAASSLNNYDNSETSMSPSDTLSPTLGIPSLFIIKDNTFSNKLKKPVQPWSPRSSFSASDRGEEELHRVDENLELPSACETAISGSNRSADEMFKSEDTLLNQTSDLLLSPLNLPRENQTKPQHGMFLAIPKEEDGFSGVSPSSEGVESFTISTAETADEMGTNAEGPVDQEASRAPSEHSGSICSGNENQTGLLKPPAVLPKSEKAVLKAMKLTNRRIKKEEAKKSSQRSSKQKTERHKTDKSELKNSRNGRNSERKHGERLEDDHHEGSQHGNHDRSEQVEACERGGLDSGNHPPNRTKMSHKKQRQSHDFVESNNHSSEERPSVETKRQGRSSNRHIRHKPEQRNYSSDRVISNIPVYKAHPGDRPTSDRPFYRSQSIDRYPGDKVGRRLSDDVSVNEKLDPRNQRIEKSIMDELQQRGRTREKASRDNPLRRSHSIDAYTSDVPNPATLSRQSSHNSQLSRQSSIEHAIVTQSFPMTQRKLLQDPDSGQYFFVDMPVQIKTKTFYDPETGSYVQLPVQPPEGTVLQASPMEVLTPPVVVYHGFVPVPLSPMAQNATIQAPLMEPEEVRHFERSRQIHCKEGETYLEPVCDQHDNILGEFLGTEELDCPS